jgi:hypothetical protein
MHGKLNVFVISCLYTGEVKTLTLALHGWYIVYYNVAFRSTIVLCFLCLTSNVTIELPDGSAKTLYRELMLILEKCNVPLAKLSAYVQTVHQPRKEYTRVYALD